MIQKSEIQRGPDALERTEEVRRKFDAWITAHPNRRGERRSIVDVPKDLLNVLIPTRVYELASDPEHLDVFIVADEKYSSTDILSLVICERNSPLPLTDTKSWEKWRKLVEETKHFHTPGPEINALHAEHSYLIGHGLDLHSRIFVSLSLEIDRDHPENLFVFSYDGEPHVGIGSQFYLDTLPYFAKKLEFRFITGVNNDANKSFFTDQVGRFTANELKKEVISEIFPRYARKGVPTVQFLYPEDQAKYLSHRA